MPKQIKVALITSHTLGQAGSMAAYAEMVQQALKDRNEIADVQIVNLLEEVPKISFLPIRFNQRLNQLWLLTQTNHRLRQVQADIYHFLDGSFAYALNKFNCNSLVITVHDLIPVLQTEGKFSVNPPSQLAQWLINKNLEVLQNSNYIYTVSERTAKDLQEHLNSSRDIYVIHSAAVRSTLLTVKSSQVKPWIDRQIENARYLLHIGNNGFYKNRQTVAKVFIELAKNYPIKLVMAGAPPDKSTRQLLKEYIQQEKVIFVNYPDDQTLAQLYEQASILLFPSYYEGFGWPPLEAMAFGCPVVCSNAGSLPEVVGQGTLMADPNDQKGLIMQCQRLLDNPDLVNQQIELGFNNIKRFSYQSLADNLVKLYRKVIIDSHSSKI